KPSQTQQRTTHETPAARPRQPPRHPKAPRLLKPNKCSPRAAAKQTHPPEFIILRHKTTYDMESLHHQKRPHQPMWPFWQCAPKRCTSTINASDYSKLRITYCMIPP